MTEPEWRLWHRLKGRGLNGFKVARQVPTGPFILDFCCREEKLAIEIDGWTHDDPASDARRTAWLEGQGYRVIRFANDEVMTNIEGVLETILLALQK